MEDKDEERLFMAYYIYANVTNVLIRFDKRDYYSTTNCPRANKQTGVCVDG